MMMKRAFTKEEKLQIIKERVLMTGLIIIIYIFNQLTAGK